MTGVLYADKFFVNDIFQKRNMKLARKNTANTTQTFRIKNEIKRLTRRIICFSKPEEMHNIVIGLFINRYEFETAV